MPPKKPQLTPEETKQRKLAKRAEKKRLAEIAQQKRVYDHLDRELAYGKRTMERHEKSWREMLMTIATPKMREELVFAWHHFERTMDDKDFTISILMDELNQADEQSMRNMRSHMDNIDNLIILCYDQIKELRDDSKKVIQNLYTAATFERNDIIGITKDNEEYQRTMLFMLENAKKESEKLIRGEYLSKQQFEISKLDDFRAKFTDELKQKFDKMFKDSQDFMKQYLNECAVRKKEYTEINDQDIAMHETIKRLWNKIRTYLDTIKTMRRKFDDLQLVQNRKLTDLMDERNHYDKLFKLAKREIHEELLLDDKNLTLLTLHSKEVIEYLRNIEEQGERLLTLSAICRKYETSKEKILSFPDFGDITGYAPDLLKTDGFHPELKLFYNRMAQANVLRYEMNEEWEYLRIQNKMLQRHIHEYCQCLNCDEFVNAVSKEILTSGQTFKN